MIVDDEKEDKIKFEWNDENKLITFALIYGFIIIVMLVYVRRWYTELSGVGEMLAYPFFVFVIGMVYMVLMITFEPWKHNDKLKLSIVALTIAAVLLIGGMAAYPDRAENRQNRLDEHRIINLTEINAVVEYNVSMYDIHFYETGNFTISQYSSLDVGRGIYNYQVENVDTVFHNDRSTEESYIRIINNDTDVYQVVYLRIPIESRW